MSAYTKGPWVASNSCVTAANGEVLVACTSGSVKRNDPFEDYATARLIAAAPDLLRENSEWSSLLGKLSMAAAQHDWSEVKRLLAGLPVEFHSHDGAPAVESAAILKATQVAA